MIVMRKTHVLIGMFVGLLVSVQPPEGGLSKPSAVIGERVRTVSSDRLDRRLGIVAPKTMQRVEQVVRIILGL